MTAKLRELLDEKNRLVTGQRAVLDTADKEKRALTTEEQTNYDAAMKHVADIGTRIDNELRLMEAEQNTLKLAAELATRQGGETQQRQQDTGAQPTRYARPEYRKAWDRWLTHRNEQLTPEEHRDLQQDAAVSGGYLVAPEEFVNTLIKFVYDMVYVRQLATVQMVRGAQSLGVPSLDADIADADWTTELATGSEDTALAFGKREFKPHPVAKRIKISNKLLRNSTMGPEAIVRDRMGYKFGITQEKAFLTGSGAGQPLGLFTAAASGISTARDISAGNTATAIQFDGLIAAKYKLKAQYQQSPRTRWMFHRDAVGNIAKLKDGVGQYIWQPSQQLGQPDRLLAIPVLMSEYVPNTFTTGLYVGLIGDLSFYWIVDNLEMQVQRLIELYAETDQTGFIGRLESDGMPVLEEAFARVKLA